MVKGPTRLSAPKSSYFSVHICILQLHSDHDQPGIFPCSVLARVNFSCSFLNKVRGIKEVEYLVEKHSAVKEKTGIC